MQLPDKKCIYTVITGGYDPIFPPLQDQPGWDLLCFTDDPKAKSPFWQVRPLPSLPELEGLEKDPVRAARLVKILAHRFLQDYDYSVYMDANRILDGDMDAYVQAYEGDMLCLGPVAADAYAAAEALFGRCENDEPIDLGAPLPLSDAEREKLDAQVKRWLKAGLPEWSGCPGTGILGRWHNRDKVATVSETWALEVLEGCAQDEVAFPFACHKHKAKWSEGFSQQVLPGNFFSAAFEFAPAVPHLALMLGQDPPPPTEYPKNPPPPGGPYGGYPLVLTIGVPVSNQIGTIRRCLEGIKPILDALPSELLVIDTGSTDGTVDVCREFGARVVEFPWINDMSAARNTGIRNAKGMWYMSIDDDEWFEGVFDIIDFFQKPEYYNNYNVALYNQQNFLDDFGKDQSTHATIRTARLTPTLRFEGRIHDAMVFDKDYKLKPCYFQAAAKHFGFSKSNLDTLVAKGRRNIASLKYDVAQHPYDTRFAYQMQNEYFVIHHTEKAFPFVFWTLSIGRAGQGLAEHVNKAASQALMHLYIKFAYSQMARFAQKHIPVEKYGIGDQCALNHFLGHMHYHLCQDVAALACVRRYEEMREKYFDLSAHQQVLESTQTTTNATEDEPAIQMDQLKVRILLRTEKIGGAQAILLQENVVAALDRDAGFRSAIFTHILAGRQWTFFEKLAAARLAISPDSLFAIYQELDELAKPQYGPDITKALEHIGAPQTAFEPLLALRLLQPGSPAAAEALGRLADGLSAFTAHTARYFKSAALLEAIRLEEGPGPIFDLMDVSDVDFAIAYLKSYQNERTQTAYRQIFAWQQKENPEAGPMERFFRMQVSYLVFEKRRDEILLDPEAYKEHFFSTVDRKFEWASGLYRENLLKGEGSPLLPRDVRAACLVRQGVADSQAGDPVAALRGFKAALEIDDTLKDPLKLLVDETVQQAEAGAAQTKAQNTEFRVLLEGIKPKIEQLISAGLSQEAAAVLDQLEALAPGDEGIAALRAKLGLVPPS